MTKVNFSQGPLCGFLLIWIIRAVQVYHQGLTLYSQNIVAHTLTRTNKQNKIILGREG